MEAPVEPEAASQRQVLELLRRHGWNATSFQTIGRSFHYFFDGPDACVAYVDTGRAWVAAGAPIAPTRRLERTAARFVSSAAAQRRRAVFFGTEGRFAQITDLRPLLIGEQPVWDPADWPRTLGSAPGIREQLRRARRKDVVVRAVDSADLYPGTSLRATLQTLIDRWLANHPMAPMGFLVEIQPFTFAKERRYYVAERNGEVVGFLAAVPVYARGGWLFEDMFRVREAPNGTMELLVDAAMRGAAAEGSRFVTLGLAPLSGAVKGWLGVVRRHTASLYDFGGLYAFRAKLRPTRWDPIYVSVPLPPERRRGVARRLAADTLAIADVLAAFARGSLVGFGVETLLRGPAVVVRLLAALLVPWTVLLALTAARFFPAPVVKWAWVIFDVLLAGSLFALAARWRRWLGVTLAVAVTVDAVVTTAEVCLFNLAHLRVPVAGVALAVGIAGPSLAAVVLWNAIGHRRRARTRSGDATKR